MSKHAYLIIAHKVDKTLETLLNMIDDCRNDVFLHMDKKNTSFNPSNISLRYSKIYIIDRIKIMWGSVSQIRCELMLLEIASKTGIYDYYHLLSGQDLPIKSQDYIHDFFSKHQGQEFIRFQSVDFRFYDRVRYYHFLREIIGRDDEHPILSIFEKILIKIQKITCVKRHSNIKFQKGTNWCSITDALVRAIVKHKDEILKIYKYSYCSDEIYKQTFVYNHREFLSNLYHPEFDNSNVSIMRAIDWKRGNPYIWTINDAIELENSEMCFARKFDSDKDIEIINYIYDKWK